MWNWFNCYLSGRHDYGVWCESGTVFLRCVHCSRRSHGWAIDMKAPATVRPQPQAHALTARPLASAAPSARVVPFQRATAR
jgi:hypothetical protein